jgi:hypothetical protein
MKFASLAAGAVCAFLISAQAQATGLMTCESGDPAKWQTKENLTKKMEAEGWKIRRIKVDGGCYEVYGTTPDGNRVEAYYHPVTLEKLLVARRGEILFRKK